MFVVCLLVFIFDTCKFENPFNVTLCCFFVQENLSIKVLCFYFDSSFSSYNKEQFTPVKVEGADEQVSKQTDKKKLWPNNFLV